MFLDYTNFQTRLNQMTTAAGVTNLSAAEISTVQSGIMSKMGTIYNGFTISFTQTLPTGNHETVTFGNTATAGTFGQAPSHLGSRLFTQTSKALMAERGTWEGTVSDLLRAAIGLTGPKISNWPQNPAGGQARPPGLS